MNLNIRIKYKLKIFFFKVKDLVVHVSLFKETDHYIWEPRFNELRFFEIERTYHTCSDKSKYLARAINLKDERFRKKLLSKYSFGNHSFDVFKAKDVLVQSRHGLATKDSFILSAPFQYDLLEETRYSSQRKNKNFLRYKDRDFLLYLKRPKFQIIQKATVISTSASNLNYSHFMIDLVPKFLQCLPKLSESEYLIVNGPVKKFVIDFFNMYGYSKKLIVMSDDQAYKIKDCSIIGALSPRGNPTDEAVNLLDKIQLPIVSNSFGKSSKIYISRRLAKARRMLNEEELEFELVNRGYEIFFLEDQPISFQILLFRNAEIIVSPHGAGLTNLVFCKKGTKIIEIFTSKHLEASMFNNSAIRGLSYNFLVFESLNNNGDYIVNVNEITSFIDNEL